MMIAEMMPVTVITSSDSRDRSAHFLK